MIVRPTKIAYVLLIPTTCIGFLFGLLFSRQWYVPTGSRATPSDRSIPLAAVVDRMKDYLDQRSTGLDLVQTKEELGLNLLRPSWDEYEQGLRHAWTTFFGTAGDERFHKILDHLSLLPSPDDPLPKVVHTTDLTPRSEAPAQYNSWVEQNPDWRIHYLEDEEVDVWLKATLGDAPVVRKMEGMRGARGILRSDMFRYLILLLEGGVYTDSDTASVRPIENWVGNPDRPGVHPLLAALPHLAGIGASSTVEYDDAPNLVVSIEADCLGRDASDYLANGMARCLQIVQWTILARPFHPIFLDVLGDGLRRYHEDEKEEIRSGESKTMSVLNQFGPGAFSDAVFRYLLVRYGVHPKQLAGIENPVQYGDVVVMPSLSFHADASEPVQQGAHMVVWHGFFGRWRSQT